MSDSLPDLIARDLWKLELNFNVTHLEYTAETIRLNEIDTVLDFVASKHREKAEEQQRGTDVKRIEFWQHPWHFLIGDFNALSRSDYSEGAWSKIAQQRHASSWPYPPEDDLLNLLLNGVDSRMEQSTSRIPVYVDAITANTESEKSCFVLRKDMIEVSPHLDISKDMRCGAWTSYYGTRIDYILLSNKTYWNDRVMRTAESNTPNEFAENVALTLMENTYQVLSTIPLTDHNMVVVEAILVL